MVKSFRVITCLVATSILICGCNLPQANDITATPDENQVSTQVQLLLTQIPTVTPIILPTATTLPPTEEPQPIPTETPSEIFIPTEEIHGETVIPIDETPAETGVPVEETLVEDIPTATPLVTTNTSGSVGQGEPTWSDPLDSSGEFSIYNDTHVKMYSQDGTLVMTAANADGWHSWTLASSTPINYYYQATAKTGTCSGKDRYGLVIRAPSNNSGYAYGFSCDGQYNLRIWDGSRFTVVVDWTASDAIHAGSDQTNQIGVTVQGTQFTFYANGTQIGQVDDSTLSQGGKLGLFISATDTPGFTIQFDDVEYWEMQ